MSTDPSTSPFMVVLDLTSTDAYPVLTNALRDYVGEYEHRASEESDRARDYADTPHAAESAERAAEHFRATAATARALLDDVERQSDGWPGSTGTNTSA